MHNIPELNYITQIVFLLFEDLSRPVESDKRYHVKIHFSPGVRCRDQLAIPGEIHSPTLGSKHVQTQFVKRLPLATTDYNLSRHHSDIPGHSSNQLEPPDAGKHEVVVRRMSEQLPHAGKQYDERFKSLSETEMLKLRRKCSTGGGFPSMPATISARSKSMDALTLDSASPLKKLKKYSLSPTKLVPGSSPLQLKKGTQCVTGGVADDKNALLSSLQPGGSMANNKSAPKICTTLQLKGGMSSSRKSSAPDVYKGIASKGHSFLAPTSQPKKGVEFPRTKFSAPNFGDSLATFEIAEGEEDELSSSGQSTPNHSRMDESQQQANETNSMPVNRVTPVDRGSKLDNEQPDSTKHSSGVGDSQQPVATTGRKGVNGTGASSELAPVKSSEQQTINPLPPSDLKRGVAGTRLHSPASDRRRVSPSGYRSKQHQTFKRDLDALGKSTPLKNQGSNEQLNRQENITVSLPSALGERGQSVGILALCWWCLLGPNMQDWKHKHR